MSMNLTLCRDHVLCGILWHVWTGDGLDVHFAILFSAIKVPWLSLFPYSFPQLWQEHFAEHAFCWHNRDISFFLRWGCPRISFSWTCLLFRMNSPHLHFRSAFNSFGIPLFMQFKQRHVGMQNLLLEEHGQCDLFLSSGALTKMKRSGFWFSPTVAHVVSLFCV